MINLEVCWQQSPGSKNYHSSIESPFKDRLTKAACHHALTLLRWADVDCQQELDKVRMSRKEELEQEFKEIQEMSLTDGE